MTSIQSDPQASRQAQPQPPSPPQPPPFMNILIYVIGTRGDVQPFLAIAKRLQQDGHRVRLATHAAFREFIVEHGVEFYPLGGDPKQLSEYMVKTGGQIIPTNPKVLVQEVPRNIKMVGEICDSTWPAATAPDPEGGGGPGLPGAPFRANAIISNPVVYGHVHVAEKLRVPLHIMFPQLWAPTAAFAHPLSSSSYKTITKPSKRNLWSYKMVNFLLWLGSDTTINRFRTNVLGLRKIRIGDRGRAITMDLQIPHTHMWSPSLVPKPADWVDDDKYEVVGTATLKLSDAATEYIPSAELAAFLDSCGSEGPIYVGFGSMVLKHPLKTTLMIIEAAKRANARVLIQSNMSDMDDAADLEIPDSVFFLGHCPHEWLLPRMSAVVHHGGAGTTAAGLRGGKPTFITPFFGDQFFWGRAVVTAGVGLEPCAIADLTVDKLTVAFEALQSPELCAKAREMGLKMQREDGADGAVRSFYRKLPLAEMRCESDAHAAECNRVATKWSVRDQRRLCDQCAVECAASGTPTGTVSFTSSASASSPSLTSCSSAKDRTNIVDYYVVDYSTRGPDSALRGAVAGTGAFIHELGSGVKDFVARPVRGYRERGAKGAAIGFARACGGVVVRPVHGAVLLADHIATGHYNHHRNESGEMKTKKETVLFVEKNRTLMAIEKLCCVS